jgi:pimeloyl-ACP methyl ester carboxylesterase
MGNIVTNIAFVCPASSYDKYIPYLEFVTRNELYYSETIKHRIPIRHYIKNKKLPTMIICHGNAEDIGQTDPVELADEFNSNICLFDYAGYGLHSNKTASESACQEDVVAIYNYLVRVKKVPSDTIVVYGRSIGTGIATYLSYCLCKKNVFHRLILVSPLYSTTSTITNIWVPGDIFKNYLLAPKIHSQVLILHGDKDNIVPFICGVNLSVLFPNLYKFITLENCGHNDIMTVTYYNEIKKFIS